MKNKTGIILLIILLVIICISLISFMISIINGKSKFLFGIKFNHRVSDELVVDEEYDNNFEKIDITSDAGNIYVKTSNTEKVKVVIYGEKSNTKIEEINNELKIISKEKRGHIFSFNSKISKIEVYIPDNYEKTIKINNNYGDIEVDNFTKADIEINEDCGDVSVKEGKKVNIKNNYGDIQLDKANEAEINQSAGDVKVGEVNDINVENNYGDIKINNVYNSLKVEEDCGNVKIENINIKENSFIENNLGDIKIGSTNEIYIDASIDLGDIKINQNYPKSEITLKIKNNCGDIKVEN